MSSSNKAEESPIHYHKNFITTVGNASKASTALADLILENKVSNYFISLAQSSVKIPVNLI